MRTQYINTGAKAIVCKNILSHFRKLKKIHHLGTGQVMDLSDIQEVLISECEKHNVKQSSIFNILDIR